MDARTSHVGFPVPEALPDVPDLEFFSASAKLHVVLQTSNDKYPCCQCQSRTSACETFTTYSLLWSETRPSEGNLR